MCFEPHAFSKSPSIQGQFAIICEIQCSIQALNTATGLQEEATKEGTIPYHFTETGALIQSEQVEQEDKPEEPP